MEGRSSSVISRLDTNFEVDLLLGKCLVSSAAETVIPHSCPVCRDSKIDSPGFGSHFMPAVQWVFGFRPPRLTSHS